MATTSDFPIHTHVVSKANHNRKGVVIGDQLKSPMVVAVEWEDGNLAKVNVNDLLTEASLEDEFKAFQAEVNDKLQKAADLIREAADLASTKGKDLQDWDADGEENLFEHGLIEGAMREAGWNTSSWHC